MNFVGSYLPPVVQGQAVPAADGSLGAADIAQGIHNFRLALLPTAVFQGQ